MPADNKKKFTGFSDSERSAMRERAKELAAEAKSQKNKAQGESDVQAAIAKMSEPDSTMAKRLHTLIKESAPELSPKTWYGMPAYTKNDKIICFVRDAGKFKERYMTFGFNQDANLDEGHIWPIVYALDKLTPTEEAKIIALVKKAVN